MSSSTSGLGLLGAAGTGALRAVVLLPGSGSDCRMHRAGPEDVPPAPALPHTSCPVSPDASHRRSVRVGAVERPPVADAEAREGDLPAPLPLRADEAREFTGGRRHGVRSGAVEDGGVR